MGAPSWTAPLDAAVLRHLAASPAPEPMPPSALVAAVAWLVGRHGLSARIPIAIRTDSESLDLVPVAVDVSWGASWKELTEQVESARLNAGPPVPLHALRDESESREGPGGFPVIVAAAGAEETVLGGAALVVSISTEPDCVLAVHHDPRWISGNDAERFGRRLLRLLAGSTASGGAALGDVDLVDDEERRLLLGPWAGTPAPYPRDASVTSLLHAVAEGHPDRAAVESPEGSVTYSELLDESAAVRMRLSDAGVEPGSRVGLLFPRSVPAIAAICGVLEHGCAYVPLDPGDPEPRRRMLCEDAGLAAVLVASELEAPLRQALGDLSARISVLSVQPDRAAPSGPRAPLPPEALAGGDRAAYVMYTSGSTGRPKGVEIPHRGIVRLVRNNDFMELEDGERVLGFAPFTFDPATWEIWTPLLNGGTLVLAPRELASLAELARYVSGRRITTANFASALFQEIAEYQIEYLAGLRQLMSGGDVVSLRHALEIVERWPDMRMINAYGPTENSFLTTAHRVRPADAHRRSLPIGRPIRNTTVYILDPHLRPVPPGMVGELCTGGDGLAIGYVDRPDLTADRFAQAPFLEGPEARLYRTGDMARHLPDGSVEFLGRGDDQVKVRGFRVEPGEVEAALGAVPGIALAAVVAMGPKGDRRLRAGVVPEAGTILDTQSLGRSLRERLPEYMVPSEFLFLDRLPATSRGKLDREALAKLPSTGPSARVGASGTEETEALVAGVWASLLPGRAFGPDDPFFDVGGSSLLALRMIEELRRRAGIDLPVVRVFEFPTIRALARHLDTRHSGADGASSGGGLAEREGRTASRVATGQPRDSGAVAIIGMAGRFPGADNVSALWDLLKAGREGIHHFSAEELEVPAEIAALPGYVPRRGVLNDVEGFDAGFFRMTPRLASITDPQHRLLLEAAWQAFEDAGVVPGGDAQLVGAFVGVAQNTYYERNVRSHPDDAGSLDVVFANDKDYVSNLLAQKLDLRGPTVTVQSASSTSLTAVAMAVQALRAGSCDMALAGGASVTVPVRSGHVHEEGAMFSRDGSTKTFDRSASGTVFSDGAAVVLLKRLEDARRDGDRIQAVIHGVAVTNDGAHRASFTAPTIDGQTLAVTRALQDAGWSADSISYVEAHGTATPIGDPIEVEALTRAFRNTTERKRFCLIGSSKSNLGHLSAAAGVAGLIKTVLAMQHRWAPPTLHFEEANPAIDFEESPFVVARFGAPWQTDGNPRRAGVSSFGAGGTNVHVVLEEWPDAERPSTGNPGERLELLPISAATPEALGQRASDLARWLENGPELPSSLGDVAHTLQMGRTAFPERAFVVARTPHEARTALRSLILSSGVEPGASDSTRAGGPTPVFMFPGQGSQFPSMAAELYRTFAAVRERLDECDRLVGPLKGRRLLDWISGTGSNAPDIDAALRDTAVAQPALFAVQYAVARTLMDWGSAPGAMIGHSIGEFTAACLAGVMDLESALEIVRERGRIMSLMPPGAMSSVRADAERLTPLLDDEVEIAAYNAPRLVAVSGTRQAIEAFEARLAREEIPHRRLETSHAFHSRMMDDAASMFHDFIADIRLSPPRIPFVAGAMGRVIRDEEPTDPRYWARQLREPVRVSQGISELGLLPAPHFIDIGPRATLATLARQTPTPGAANHSSAMGTPGTADASAAEALVRTVGELWTQGQDIDWEAVREGSPGRQIGLPGYPFQRTRHWLEPATPHRYVEHRADFESVLAAQQRIIHRQMAILDELRDGSATRDDLNRS